MKQFHLTLLLMLGLAASSLRAQTPVPYHLISGTVSNPGPINAVTVENMGNVQTVNLFDDVLFDFQNMLNFINRGTFTGSPGFEFNNYNPNSDLRYPLTSFINMIENALMIDEQLKGERVLSLLELQADSYADWERKEDAWWQIFLNSCTRVSSKALSPPNSVALTDQIPRQLYRGRQPRNDSDKIETLCAILLNNQHFQEYNRRENNVLIPQLNAFKSVSLRKAGQHDFLFRMSLETLEKIVYLLENSTLSQERLDRFFLTFLRVDWEGCNEGYASKVQEMIVYLASEEGIDQLLFEKRHDLVSQFVEIRYPGSNENSMYLSGIKSALNRSLGLNFHVAGMGWGANLADEGKSFVLSNYTPTEVYSTIYTHFKNSISSAIENTFNSFEQVMAQLGVEDLERYFDSMTNEFKITAIQFDLPFLVMNYCLANHYLKWEKNIDIRPEMVAERYRQTHARQADERQQQRERELQAAMERMRAQPVYYRPASNTVYSRRGG